MLTRREVMSGAVAASGVAGARGVETQTPEGERLAGIERRLGELVGELREANRGCSTGTCDVVVKLRGDVFFTLHDWHVRNRLPVAMARTGDGRHALTFMFTQVLLRADAQPGFLGFPYDAR